MPSCRALLSSDIHSARQTVHRQNLSPRRLLAPAQPGSATADRLLDGSTLLPLQWTEHTTGPPRQQVLSYSSRPPPTVPQMSKPLKLCTPLNEEAYPWERFKEESPKAYEAFAAYRDMPRVDRSVRGAFIKSRLYGPPPEQAHPIWYDWCHRFKWRERVIAMDTYNERRDSEAEADERVKSRKLRRAVLVSALRKAGSELPNVDFSKASASDLAKFLEVVVRQLRDEYDESPTQKVSLGGLQSEAGAEIPIVITYAQSKT